MSAAARKDTKRMDLSVEVRIFVKILASITEPATEVVKNKAQ